MGSDVTLHLVGVLVKVLCRTISDGPFALRKFEVGLYGVLKSEFQTHEVGIVPNFELFKPSEI